MDESSHKRERDPIRCCPDFKSPCKEEACQQWETKTEHAGTSEDCPRDKAGQCNEGCAKIEWTRHKGHCAKGGDWITTGYTTREGSPFCGSWREPSKADD